MKGLYGRGMVCQVPATGIMRGDGATRQLQKVLSSPLQAETQCPRPRQTMNTNQQEEQGWWYNTMREMQAGKFWYSLSVQKKKKGEQVHQAAAGISERQNVVNARQKNGRTQREEPQTGKANRE